MSRKYLLLITVGGFWTAIDQLAKIYIHTQFKLGESLVVIPNLFNLTYVRNLGAAFGFLASSNASFREVFFLVIPPLAVGLIVLILRTINDDQRAQILALSSIAGGAIGNYIDRLHYYFVIDFVDIHFFNKYSWPAFNIADMAIVGGVSVLIISLLREAKVKPTTST